MRKYLFSKGFRYRINVSKLAGKPDIVLFTGNLIDKNYKLKLKEQEKLINELSKIDPTIGKYAVLKFYSFRKFRKSDEVHFADCKDFPMEKHYGTLRAYS